MYKQNSFYIIYIYSIYILHHHQNQIAFFFLENI